jgi:hypothetical protein
LWQDRPVARTDPEANAVEAELMSLEELAERTGVAPRTIRFYQTKKLL